LPQRGACQPVRAQVATKVVASMLALESLDDTADIKLYINSQGALRPRRAARAAALRSGPSTCACRVLGVRARWSLLSAPAGGQAYSINAILDTIEAVQPDVSTIAIGLCASTATLLLVRSPAAACRHSACNRFRAGRHGHARPVQDAWS